jgi:D-sedoheptulose 7-phosphate isomerase
MPEALTAPKSARGAAPSTIDTTLRTRGEPNVDGTEFADNFLAETIEIIRSVSVSDIERVASGLAEVRTREGRLFILGVGGSAGHASHAVNDFRKICSFEAYAPTDNISELTARTNDDGWDTTFSSWLAGSRLRSDDGIMVFSVGGGNQKANVSVNLIRALAYGQEVGAAIYGIVGRDGGYTAEVADACIVIPALYPERTTPHTEGLCAVFWHLLVSHPKLAAVGTKWEAVDSGLDVRDCKAKILA